MERRGFRWNSAFSSSRSVGPDQNRPSSIGAKRCISRLRRALGYAHVRTVEHYFDPYGGYSPNPLIFLTAAAAITRTSRLVTGAVLPVFNHPLKLAGEIGMVDAISNGRLEVGFARAFLPHEFARFGISVDESRARFDEGMEPSAACSRRRTSPRTAASTVSQRDLAAAADAEAAPAVLDGGAGDAGIFEKPAGRPPRDGNPAGRRQDGGAAGALSRGLARGGPSRQGPRHARVPYVLRREPREGRGDRARAAQPLSEIARRRRVGVDKGGASKDYPGYDKIIATSPRRPSRRRSRRAPPGSARRTRSANRSRSTTRTSAASNRLAAGEFQHHRRSGGRSDRCGCSPAR